MINVMNSEKNSKDILFKKTIEENGVIQKNNPFKNDKDFLTGLIAYYESIGEYDKCIPLLNKVLTLI